MLTAASAVMGVQHNHDSRPEQPLSLLTRALKSPAAALDTASTQTAGASQAAAGHPRPRTLFIGLGGGTLPLALHHHFPGMDIDAIELDPVVVEAAQDAMAFPADRQVVPSCPGWPAQSLQNTSMPVLWWCPSSCEPLQASSSIGIPAPELYRHGNK